MRDDDFFLPKPAVAELREALTRTIPSLVEDLAVTTTRQDRITRGRLHNGRRGKPESRPPMNFDSAGAAQELHNALVGGVRLMCESRAMGYDGDVSTLGLCGWLRRNLIALAMTEGAEDVHHEITGAVRAALRVVDLPADDDIVISAARVQAANRQVVTADAAERIAGRLGGLGVGLTAARVRLLRKKGHLRPCSADPDTRENFYRLGDVLDAHHRIGRRKAAS